MSKTSVFQVSGFSKLFIATILVAVSALVLLGSCWWEPSYPQQLTQADSLLMRGCYEQADDLLAEYDNGKISHREAFVNYRQLLAMSRKFVDGVLTDSDFSIVDSLCRYYADLESHEKYAKALCFEGNIYYVSNDYPSAMNALLKASKLAEECNDVYLLGWIKRTQGDIYFDQRMLDECVDYYRQVYHIAVATKDTLRMAYASFGMGRVYTILNNVDSTIYYYKKAKALASHTKRGEYIIPYANSSLSDIYIQIEEYDSAMTLMPYDSLNDINWAYWHMGQGHIDSAVYYFEQVVNRGGMQGRASTLRLLSQLEEQRGNSSKTMGYYKQLLSIKDSIQQQSQIEATRKVVVQDNLNKIKRKHDEMARHSRIVEIVLFVVLFIVLLGMVLAYYVWHYYKQKRKNELAHESLLRKEEEERLRQSNNQIEQNNRKIAELESLLADARQRDDTQEVNKLKLDAEWLEAENRSIEANQRRRDYLLQGFQASPLYVKIKLNAGKEKFHLTDEEWRQLAQGIDEAYGQFTQRLLSLVDLSEVELRTCYLIRLKIAPTDIALMLYKSKAAITMLRQRLYEKITQKKGSAKQLDEFIMNF